jgi:hypothetical protein
MLEFGGILGGMRRKTSQNLFIRNAMQIKKPHGMWVKKSRHRAAGNPRAIENAPHLRRSAIGPRVWGGSGRMTLKCKKSVGAKRTLLRRGTGGRTRTDTVLLPMDFEFLVLSGTVWSPVPYSGIQNPKKVDCKAVFRACGPNNPCLMRFIKKAVF